MFHIMMQKHIASKFLPVYNVQHYTRNHVMKIFIIKSFIDGLEKDYRPKSNGKKLPEEDWKIEFMLGVM